MEIPSVIDIDAHSQLHAAASLDRQGRPRQLLPVGAAESELDRLVTWVQQQPGPRLVAVEGAKGYGRALTHALLAAGETVVDVATHLTADARRRLRRRGKDDEGDAIAIGRVALRESDLPQMNPAHLDADLKLLVDARDQLVAEQGRVRNRFHALLLARSPGHRAVTGALISTAALARARSLALKARWSDPVRAQLALAAIRRQAALSTEIGEMEAGISAVMATRPHQHLFEIPGVGMLTAAKIVGETHDVRHSRSAAAFAAHASTAPIPAKRQHQPPSPQPRWAHRTAGQGSVRVLAR